MSALAEDLLQRQGYIDGRWVDADDGETFEVIDPATGESIAAVPRMGAAETRRAIEAAGRALPGWRSLLAKRAGADPAPLERPDARAPGGAGGAADDRAGQAAGRSHGRGRLRGELSGMVRRGGQAGLRRHHPDLRARPAHRRHQGAGRRHRRDNAVELPRRDANPQGGPGAGRRLHDGAQAGRADAAHRAGGDAPRRGGGAAARRAERRHRRRAGRSGHRR